MFEKGVLRYFSSTLGSEQGPEGQLQRGYQSVFRTSAYSVD